MLNMSALGLHRTNILKQKRISPSEFDYAKPQKKPHSISGCRRTRSCLRLITSSAMNRNRQKESTEHQVDGCDETEVRAHGAARAPVARPADWRLVNTISVQFIPKLNA
ncbi:hypothetical protein Y032_0084g1714 [Ancylostoma ceylanicum]|uniref:Uncharacterized protein n=1 Tax=Ancylostoma ceylanicum TaxID=53326 RepID=A0A016TRF9_9BILA|nr:hypothetical protein Y032_0084g1714 [Ancylostoma ceylanicum]